MRNYINPPNPTRWRYLIQCVSPSSGKWVRHREYEHIDKARQHWVSLNWLAPHRLVDRVTGEVVEGPRNA